MKRSARNAAWLAACLAFLAAWLAGAAQAQGLPANGDFDQGGTPPAGWTLDADVAAAGTMTRRPAPAGTAGQMLVLSPNARNTRSEKPYGIGQVVPAAALRGREVVVSAMLGATGGARAVLGFAVLSRAGAAPVFLRNDGPLAPREERVSVPDDPGIQGIILFVAAEGTTGEAQFAAISLRTEGGGNAAPSRSGAASPPTPAATPAPDYAATVSVDTTRILRIIPRGIFGTNIEVIRDANGLWDSRANRLDPELVRLARDMALGPIRFPGGVWSDTYDWRHGAGPAGRRATTPTHPGATETFRHNFGIDEALAFARAVDSTLLLTVNAANGNPALAADWVRYVNGEGGRNPRGPRVTLWQVGNELYMDGDASGGHLRPEQYADRFIAYARAMKEVDPGIRVAAIGLRNFGRYRLNHYGNWNEVVLRRAGAEMDMLTVHNGYAPVLGDDASHEPADVYAAMWAAPLLVARNLADTRREIERFAPASAGRISLGVTEWGPLFAVSVGSPWVDHVKTLGSAVFVASMLKVFAEEPKLDVANFFKLNEASFMGWIGRARGAWAPTAPYYAFRMVSRDMAPGLLASEAAGPRYASRALGFFERVSDVPTLDVLATRTPEGAPGPAVATILLINKSVTATAVARVSLRGSAGAERLVTQTLTGAAVDANTGTELPRVPGLNWAAQREAGPGGRFRRGAPDEVRIVRDERANPGAQSELRVPPHSLMLLRFEGLRRP